MLPAPGGLGFGILIQELFSLGFSISNQLALEFVRNFLKDSAKIQVRSRIGHCFIASGSMGNSVVNNWLGDRMAEGSAESDLHRRGISSNPSKTRS